jgi:hypothetical protein
MAGNVAGRDGVLPFKALRLKSQRAPQKRGGGIASCRDANPFCARLSMSAPLARIVWQSVHGMRSESPRHPSFSRIAIQTARAQTRAPLACRAAHGMSGGYGRCTKMSLREILQDSAFLWKRVGPGSALCFVRGSASAQGQSCRSQNGSVRTAHTTDCQEELPTVYSPVRGPLIRRVVGRGAGSAACAGKAPACAGRGGPLQ